MDLTINTSTLTYKPLAVCGVNFFDGETSSVWREEWYGMKYEKTPAEAHVAFERLALALGGRIDEVKWIKEELAVIACIMHPLPASDKLN